jgi:hypothetical protein
VEIIITMLTWGLVGGLIAVFVYFGFTISVSLSLIADRLADFQMPLDTTAGVLGVLRDELREARKEMRKRELVKP